MLKEFRDFIAKGNVMDMAVGIIIGAAFTAIVTSLVNDLINPIIGLFTGGLDFTNNYAVLSGEVAAGASLEDAREAGASVFAGAGFGAAFAGVFRLGVRVAAAFFGARLAAFLRAGFFVLFVVMVGLLAGGGSPRLAGRIRALVRGQLKRNRPHWEA